MLVGMCAVICSLNCGGEPVVSLARLMPTCTLSRWDGRTSPAGPIGRVRFSYCRGLKDMTSRLWGQTLVCNVGQRAAKNMLCQWERGNRRRRETASELPGMFSGLKLPGHCRSIPEPTAHARQYSEIQSAPGSSRISSRGYRQGCRVWVGLQNLG